MHQRRKRFPKKLLIQRPKSQSPKTVFKDSSYLKFLEIKNFVDSEFSLGCQSELLNASELAKSRKTWPFFSENKSSTCLVDLINSWSKWWLWKPSRTHLCTCILRILMRKISNPWMLVIWTGMIPKVYSQNMLNLQFCIKQNL